MDSLIATAGRALAAGDPLAALNLVALREDASALALRGIAMAQLGDLVRARALVRRAARAFGTRDVAARARCVIAEAEIALAARDLQWPTTALDAARATLESHGDRVNAAHARYLEVRRLVTIGRLVEAERLLVHVDPARLPPAHRAAHESVVAGIALRRLHTKAARGALLRAERAARESRIPALIAEVNVAASVLTKPAARLVAHGQQRTLTMDEVERVLASKAFVVDACRYGVRCAGTDVSLASRPVLFTLVRALAEAWPDDVSRDHLVARAFRARRADESHRARLRVEIGRLRKVLHAVATISATDRGFVLSRRQSGEVVILTPPSDEPYTAVFALLQDGESWSSSALALALGTSQRSVQRALDALAEAGRVQSVGRGRARRWMAPPLPGFATTLLLPSALPIA
jgi:hypothetical protein